MGPRSIFKGFTRSGIAVALVVGGAIGLSACSSGSGSKPHPTPSSTSTGAGRGYIASEWVNQKTGVFSALADSTGPASIQSAWVGAFQTDPPPATFVTRLGHVPVLNGTNGTISNGKAQVWGQEFLEEQGYEDYFLSQGSGVGVSAVVSDNAYPGTAPVTAALTAGTKISVVGCALPVTLQLVPIPTTFGQGANEYGFVATFSSPGGKCHLQTASGTVLFSSSNVPDLFFGAPKALAPLGTIWYSTGAASCPGFQPGDVAASYCTPTSGGNG
jgi:hypothetical protein